MKKFMCLLCVCMLLFSSVASADQVYAAEKGSRQTAATVKKIDLKCGTATTVQVKAKKNQEIEWSILNWLHPKTRERIVNVEEQKNGRFLIQGLLPGKCTLVVKVGKKTYQYKITLHTNGFQRKKTKIHAFPDRSEEKYVFVQPLQWEKIEDADGYIIYGVQHYSHVSIQDHHKLKVIYNKNQTKWRYQIKNTTDKNDRMYFKTYLIRGFKKTKAGITIYTQYEAASH